MKFLSLFPEDISRTDSRRTEPSSRSTLLDEQSNPYKLLHL